MEEIGILISEMGSDGQQVYQGVSIPNFDATNECKVHVKVDKEGLQKKIREQLSLIITTYMQVT